MATPLNRFKAAWATGDPLTLHREVGRVAAEGYPRQILEDALEALLLDIRAVEAGDDSEEIINGVWDRLTGACHLDNHIATLPGLKQVASVDTPVDGKILANLPAQSTLR